MNNAPDDTGSTRVPARATNRVGLFGAPNRGGAPATAELAAPAAPPTPDWLPYCDPISPERLPTVSLCVTAYNYGRFLGDCIESILTQSYPNIECIVVDDGSDDDTGDVLARYAGRIKTARNNAPQGQLAAMVAGFQLATGTFVSFVDADDFLYPDFVRAHVAAHLSPATFVAMSTSLQHNVDAAGRLHSVQPLLEQRPLLRLPRGSNRHGQVDVPGRGAVAVTTCDPQCNFAHQWLWGTTTSMMFRREALELIFDPPPDGARICADNYLARFCHAIGGTAVVELPLSAYRRHGGNYFADNVVVGGLSPLTTQERPDQDAQPLIAQQIARNNDALYRALGPRRFVVTAEKFCTIGDAMKALRPASRSERPRLLMFLVLLRALRCLRVTWFRCSRIAAMVSLTETA